MIRSSRHIRLSFLTVFVLCLVVALVSCSKKDVRQDEAIEETVDVGEESMGEEMMSEEGDLSAEAVEGFDAGMAAAPSGLQTLYFDFDRYNIRNDGRAALQDNAEWLKANPNATVQIEGHCDERGTIEYNLALGERRGNAAKDYLSRLGVDTSRMSIISYGEERPSNPASDEMAWSENRRAEFVVLSQ